MANKIDEKTFFIVKVTPDTTDEDLLKQVEKIKKSQMRKAMSSIAEDSYGESLVTYYSYLTDYFKEFTKDDVLDIVSSFYFHGNIPADFEKIAKEKFPEFDKFEKEFLKNFKFDPKTQSFEVSAFTKEMGNSSLINKTKHVIEFLKSTTGIQEYDAEFTFDNAKFNKEDLTKLLDMELQKTDIKIHSSSSLKATALEDIIEAQEKADMLVDHIQSLNLSPFEKFILIHDFCAGKPYRISDDNEPYDCRQFVHCMTKDRIVCAGYSVLMEYLCERVGIECPEVVGQKVYNDARHAFNIVHLVDPKYNIDGNYLCDACWNGWYNYFGGVEKTHLTPIKTRNYLYLAFPLQEVPFDNHSRFLDLDDEFVKKFGNRSKRIDLQTLKTAVENSYKALDGEYYNPEDVDWDIVATVYNEANKDVFAYPGKLSNVINLKTKSDALEDVEKSDFDNTETTKKRTKNNHSERVKKIKSFFKKERTM